MSDEFYDFQNSIPEKIIVLDAGSLIAGLNVQIIDDATCYSTDNIIKEVKNKNVKLKMNYYNEFQSIKIIDVPQNYIEKIINISTESGDFKFLSENDIQILALALYLRTSYSKITNTPLENVPIELISDDYSVQNIAKSMNLDFRGYKRKGINKFIKWELYCPSCKHKYKGNYKFDDCEICGEKLKRRALKNQKQSK